MKQLILLKKCPLGAVSPVLIDLEGLFHLDVDDNIWQDIGLTDENDNSIDIPPWLANDNVREGIRALLDYNRCEEEEERLKQERISLQQWFTEEWIILDAAIAWSQDEPEVLYQLLERHKYLLKLCIIWQPCLKNIPCSEKQEWGPTDVQLVTARLYEKTEQVVFQDGVNTMDTSDTDNSASESDYDTALEDGWGNNEDDAELFDHMEANGLAENFRYH